MNKYIHSIIIILFLSSCSLYAQGTRGIKMEKFIPKGQWIIGSNISFQQSTQENYNFLVIESATGDGYTFKFSPILAYTIKNNLAVGGRFGYQRTFVKLDKVDFEIGNDLNFDIKNIYSLSHEFSGVALARNYISIADSKRFALFSEGQLKLSGGQSKYIDGRGNQLTGTYSTNFSAELGVVPGLVAFINNYTAVEVSIGVLGISYSQKKQVTDQIHHSSQTTSAVNFRINIFSVGMGIAFYL